MPAVFVEVGFGSNVDDARWMASVEGQRDIAEAHQRRGVRVPPALRAAHPHGRTLMAPRLEVSAAGLTFQNPILLAAGHCRLRTRTGRRDAARALGRHRHQGRERGAASRRTRAPRRRFRRRNDQCCRSCQSGRRGGQARGPAVAGLELRAPRVLVNVVGRGGRGFRRRRRAPRRRRGLPRFRAERQLPERQAGRNGVRRRPRCTHGPSSPARVPRRPSRCS
jgi:hypothetical protein